MAILANRLLLLSLLVFLAGCGHANCSAESTQPATAPKYDFEGMDVYRVGAGGPHLIVIHELGGLSEATFFLAEQLAAAGYQVHFPLLFGDAGDNNWVTGLLKGCLRPSFNCRSREHPGRIVLKIGRLAQQLAGNSEGSVGVIGNCLTGSWAAALLREKGPVGAAVMSQPSLPLFGKSAIGFGPKLIAKIQKSAVPILALRFSNDSISPAPRMERFQRTFGSQLRVITIPSGCASAAGIPENAHAVLTKELSVIPGHPTQQAYEDVVAYLDSRLKGARP